MTSTKKFKWLKRIGIFLGILVAAIGILFVVSNESLPQGKTGSEADALAQKVLTAINKTAWDNTGAITWNFAGRHDFVWDKKRHFTEVKWEDNRVLINLHEPIKGIAYKAGTAIVDKSENDKLVQEAWSYWANDSFWLNAPAKVFDAGTGRSIVKLDDGSDGLMITYSSGGVTPGDSYLWILDKDGLPKSYKMWVQIIPIGGAEATWTEWKTLSTGAKISTSHKLGPIDIAVTNLKGATTLSELVEGEDMFAELE
ncbi:MAG: hypothetical protein ACPGVB_04650 [Chitinophagales bacterium]